MKNIFTILLFITCHAYGQIPDTFPGYIHTGGTYIHIPGDSLRVELLNIRRRQVMVQQLQMGMHVLYIPETDVAEGNSINQHSKVITYQIAMSDVVTEVHKEKIKRAIDSILYGSIVVPPPVAVIDTVDSANSTFIPAWTRATSATANWYKGTIEYSNTLNATATYQHTAPYTRIEIWGEKKSTHGKISVSIDNGTEEVIDLYSATQQLPSLIHTFDVPLGIHEIKIRITGTKNAASSNTYGIIDFYRFTR